MEIQIYVDYLIVHVLCTFRNLKFRLGTIWKSHSNLTFYQN